MKVVIVTDLYQVGGRDGSLGKSDVIRDFILNGVGCYEQVSVVKITPEYFPRRPIIYEDYGFLVYDISIFKFKGLYLNSLRNSFNSEILELIIDADVVVVHMQYQLYWIMPFLTDHTKVVSILHDSDLMYNRLNATLKRSNHIGFRSVNIKKTVHSLYELLPSKDIGIFYSGIKITSEKIKDRFKWSLLKNRLDIVFAGNLISRKNIDKLIHSVSELNFNYNLHIVGDGPEHKKLVKLASDLNLSDRVKFHGNKDQEFVRKMMLKSHVFIMPSYNETLGMAYIEALNSDMIVIGMKNEGIDGIINDNVNGFLLDSSEPSIISRKIKYCYEMELNKLMDISFHGFNTSLKFDIREQSKNYFKRISDCVES